MNGLTFRHFLPWTRVPGRGEVAKGQANHALDVRIGKELEILL